MKSIIYIVGAILFSSSQGLQLRELQNYPMTKNEEARAIENAVTQRVVDNLTSKIPHAEDPNNIAAIYAYRGHNPNREDYLKTLAKLGSNDPLISKVVERVNHPYYPYKKGK